ncbi:MAG: hypothetical protein P4L66_08855 [Acetobacteraceae bacterium]|nr:hypothetical protein [Acetobacteraceae bacterium]
MDVKEAVKVAKLFAAELFAEDGAYDPLLEEVERDQDKGTWQVTLSFQRRSDPGSDGALASFVRAAQRTYKVITIADDNKEVLSVKVREGLH